MTSTDPNVLMNRARCIAKCIPPGMQGAVEIGIVSQEGIVPIFPCGEPTDCIVISGGGELGANQLYQLFSHNPISYLYTGVTDSEYHIEHSIEGLWLLGYDDLGTALYRAYDPSGPCVWLCGQQSDSGLCPAPTGAYVACVATNCIDIDGPVVFPDVLGVYINDGSGVYYNSNDPTFTLEPCPEFGGIYGIVANHNTANAYYTAVNFPYTWEIQLLEPPAPTGNYVECPVSEDGLVVGGDQLVVEGDPLVL